MSEIFLTVLNMSVTAAFVIVALCVARLVLQRMRAPRRISYALWAVAGFRLAVPFKIESIFSLIPRNIPEVTAPPRVYVDIPPRPAGTQEWQQWLLSSDHSAYSRPVWSVFDTLTVVWILGIAAMLLYAVISYVRLIRRKDSVTTPFVYGFVKPKIHMPSGLSGEALRYVTLHEQTHIKRRDYLVKTFAFALLCVHWFNPFAWLAFVLLCADMEMSCDERVLRELGADAKADYSQTLLSLSMNRRILSASPLAFGEGGIKARVKNALNFKKPSRRIVAVAAVLVICLSIGFAVTNVESEDSVPTDLLSGADWSNVEYIIVQIGNDSEHLTDPVDIAKYIEALKDVQISKRDTGAAAGGLQRIDTIVFGDTKMSRIIIPNAPDIIVDGIPYLATDIDAVNYLNFTAYRLFGMDVKAEYFGVENYVPRTTTTLRPGALSALRTPYVGDNSAVGKIIGFLPPLDAELTQRFFSIGDDYGTGHAPYTLTLYYEQDGTERNITVMPKNAALLFALIDNLEEVNFAFRNTPSDGDLDKAAYTSRIAVNKEQIGDFIGSLSLTWEDFRNDFEAAAAAVFTQSAQAETPPPQTMFALDVNNGGKMTLYADAITRMRVLHITGGQSTGYGIADKMSIARIGDWVGDLSVEREYFAYGQTPGDSEGGEVYDFTADDGSGFAGLFFYGNYGSGKCYIVCDDVWYKVKNPSDPPLPATDMITEPSLIWSQDSISSESKTDLSWSQDPASIDAKFSSPWPSMEDLPLDYGKDAAIADGVYVNIHGAEIYNQKLVDIFYESVFAAEPAIMRTMEYTVEGDPIIADYWFDGEVFTVITDMRRDSFGSQEITSATYKYLVPLDRARYEGTLRQYFLSNEQNIYANTRDGGTTLIDDLARIPSPSGSVITP
jgi:beta-lactamase regulating signal transducer with metallopeptidase domain